MKLLIYPDSNHPNWKFTMLKFFCEFAGVEVVRDKHKPFDKAFYLSYHKTFRQHTFELLELHTKHKIINFGCEDVRKSYVEEVMLKTFGYNAVINPEKSNLFLEKSELQGSHSLKICDKFEKYTPNCIYVKFLDGRINENTIRDYRIYIYGNRISTVITVNYSLHKI